MKQFTVNIPDHYIETFQEYISNMPNASIIDQEDFEMNNEIISILDKSKEIIDVLYLSKEDSNRLLKKKYGI